MKTNTHFLIRDESNESFYDIRMEAWKEDTNVEYKPEGLYRSVFTLLEEIQFFSSKSPDYSITRFRANFGLNMAQGHSARSKREFIKSKITEFPSTLTVSEEEEYRVLRKKIFDLRAINPFLNPDNF